MVKLVVIIVLVLAIVFIVFGIGKLTNVVVEKDKTTGELKPLPTWKRAGIVFIILTIIYTLVNIVLASDHPYVMKLKSMLGKK